jgi:hypothetical protein|tara:strand:+ start:606 stop:860 length:255 start_codon:yes stop_codon:yes gene_type:complete
MINRSIKILKSIIQHPYLDLAVVGILLYSGISETLSEMEERKEFKLGVHHGIILFSIMHILKTLPELVKHWGRAINKLDEKKNN